MGVKGAPVLYLSGFSQAALSDGERDRYEKVLLIAMGGEVKHVFLE